MWCYRKILIIESSVSSSASFLCRPGKCTHWLHHVSMHHGKFLCTEWRLVKKLECMFFRSSIALLHIFFRNIISNLKAFLNSLGKHFTTSSRQGNLGVAQKNTSALWPAALADFAGFANWRSLRTDGRPKWSCRRARRKKTHCFGWGCWGSSWPGLYGVDWNRPVAIARWYSFCCLWFVGWHIFGATCIICACHQCHRSMKKAATLENSSPFLSQAIGFFPISSFPILPLAWKRALARFYPSTRREWCVLESAALWEGHVDLFQVRLEFDRKLRVG